MNKKYWNASHNVYAYRVSGAGDVERFSDDGEPQGSAGMPVLNVLASRDIKNTCIVVTRYFGGTLLGVGGLVRAYGKAAAAGLEAAGVAEMALVSEFSVAADYSLLGKLQYYAASGGHYIEDTVYTDKAELVILVRKEKNEEFIKGVSDAASGQARITKKGEKYVDLAML